MANAPTAMAPRARVPTAPAPTASEPTAREASLTTVRDGACIVAGPQWRNLRSKWTISSRVARGAMVGSRELRFFLLKIAQGRPELSRFTNLPLLTVAALAPGGRAGIKRGASVASPGDFAASRSSPGRGAGKWRSGLPITALAGGGDLRHPCSGVRGFLLSVSRSSAALHSGLESVAPPALCLNLVECEG